MNTLIILVPIDRFTVKLVNLLFTSEIGIFNRIDKIIDKIADLDAQHLIGVENGMDLINQIMTTEAFDLIWDSFGVLEMLRYAHDKLPHYQISIPICNGDEIYMSQYEDGACEFGIESDGRYLVLSNPFIHLYKAREFINFLFEVNIISKKRYDEFYIMIKKANLQGESMQSVYN